VQPDVTGVDSFEVRRIDTVLTDPDGIRIRPLA